ncbi:MAG: hypothetical protein JZU63_00115, partial [Rhodoferax sp.]|nr:hypothetical protein [Rhodoferax sp.]
VQTASTEAVQTVLVYVPAVHTLHGEWAVTPLKQNLLAGQGIWIEAFTQYDPAEQDTGAVKPGTQ